MLFACNCPECQILHELDRVSDNLFYIDFHGGDGPCTYYKYPDDDAKEIAHQRGMKAGLIFRYNELLEYKAR